jgi:asparagine synthase (glutamine-hydrolysing)
MAPYLPHELMYRRKMGFSVPLARWFRGPLRERVREAVLGPEIADSGLFNAKFLQHLVRAHESGLRDYSASLWSLLMFQSFLTSSVQDAAGSRLLGSAA